MASIAKPFFLLFLMTLVFALQVHARDSQLFNKVPRNNGQKETEVLPNNVEAVTNNQQPQELEPDFIPENENGGYGLYGHESRQLPSTTAEPTNVGPYKTTTKTQEPYKTATTNIPESYPTNLPKYLPKNYNTEAYVTEPEGYRGDFENNNNNNNVNNYDPEGFRGEFDNNKNTNFYNGVDNSYYHNEQNGVFGGTQLSSKSYTTNPENFYYYNNGRSNAYYHGKPQGLSDTRFDNSQNRNYDYNHNVGDLSGVQKQGMSDTRFLEKGKYFYDVNMEQKFSRGPYGETNNRGYYANPDNYNQFNNNYQNQEQFQNFQNEDVLP